MGKAQCWSKAGVAIPALGCVAAAAIACTSSLGVKGSTIAKVVEGLDVIVGWA